MPTRCNNDYRSCCLTPGKPCETHRPADARRRAFIRDCWCVNCGHPVMAEGVAIDPTDDTDREGHGRDRCDDTACESAAVARYMGGVLIVARDAS